ncbi:MULTISPECIES: ACP S-malonyltransferase [unclassified Streptomyces]|uniref:ACP S-malonyltransferase n=1 Tax=Streptomycetaceae TaxID=2062 RepID=UPI002E7A58A6|nr:MULTISPECIES: ACP S-malonyltransferase [unclassified Streptomyces]MED7953384.1 ACP S-malonyltransferase [Streptomyces sp. BE303]MEE1823150.1 ACP S-malonyltransferase [Streptomyces sp. BE20]
MLVIVAPGQGAQTPGFLSPWLELDGVADRLRGWSEVAGLDLVHAGTEASAEEIKDTAVAQPLLVAAGLVTAGVLFPDGDTATAQVGAVAGHSVGEITAAAFAGALTPHDALTFVRERSLAMAEAAAAVETGMAALLGGDPEVVAAKLAEHGLTAANNNGGGQIVAAGTLPQLDALRADPPAGARLVALKVAGAFHTTHMAPGVERLAKLAPTLPVADPGITYVSNQDGEVVAAGDELLRRLVSQVSNPVRWDLCMETLQQLGATAVIELAPAGTLTGLVKRNLKGVASLALKTPADLEKAHALIAEHAGPGREHSGQEQEQQA